MSKTTNILIRRGDQTWRVGDDGSTVIDSPDAPDWFSLEDDSRAARVKVGLGRSVWRVALADKTVFVKRFESSSIPGASIWERLIGSRAEREWNANLKALSIDLPAARCLAWGICHGKQALLFEGIPDSVTLADWWERARTQRRNQTQSRDCEFQSRDREGAVEPFTQTQQNQIIRCVARLTAKAHRFGFVHRDGHPGNILISMNDPQPGSPLNDSSPYHVGPVFNRSGDGLETRTTLVQPSTSARFLDLLGARFLGHHVPERLRRRSIAQFNHYFSDDLTPRSKLRFIIDYWNTFSSSLAKPRSSHPDDAAVSSTVTKSRRKAAIHRFLEDVNDLTLQHAESLARQRDRRIGRNGSYFATIKLGNGWRAIVTLKLARRRVFPDAGVSDRTVSDWVRVLTKIGLKAENDPSEPTHTTQAINIMDRSSLARSLSTQGLALLSFSDGCVVAKSRVQHGSPRRQFVRNHKLRHRDQPHDLMLAYVERRSWLRVADSFLIVPADLRFQKLLSSEIPHDV